MKELLLYSRCLSFYSCDPAPPAGRDEELHALCLLTQTLYSGILLYCWFNDKKSRDRPEIGHNINKLQSQLFIVLKVFIINIY